MSPSGCLRQYLRQIQEEDPAMLAESSIFGWGPRDRILIGCKTWPDAYPPYLSQLREPHDNIQPTKLAEMLGCSFYRIAAQVKGHMGIFVDIN